MPPPPRSPLPSYRYVKEFHTPESDEPVFPLGPIYIAIDDNTKLGAADYRDRLYREIQQRKVAKRRDANRQSAQAAAADAGMTTAAPAAAPAGGPPQPQQPPPGARQDLL